MLLPEDIAILAIIILIRSYIKKLIFFWTKRSLEAVPRSQYYFQVTIKWNNKSFATDDFFNGTFFLKVLFNHKCNVQSCLFYRISLTIASKYLMKPFCKFWVDLLANYAIKKKIFLEWDIQSHRKIKTKKF